MTDHATTAGRVYPPESAAENFGLHAGVLGPVETLAQSVSAVAPSTSPSLTIPLVFALAGNATWFVYLLATAAILLIGFCVSRFARLSASPGSLYTYTANTLRPIFGVTTAWALLLAYVATGASVAGGALYYGTMLTQQFFHWTPPALPTLALVCAVAGWVAYRDVKLSAELMLWIEVVSVSLILIVLLVLMAHFGLQLDVDQFRLKGVHISSLGPALVLSIFSFVGFESATTLGAEARDPLRTIPRAVIQCALLAGAFFMLCSYSEVVGFRGESGKLSETTSPLHILAGRAGISPLGVGIDLGAFISVFACVLACTTAAARVLMLMARGKLLPGVFRANQPAASNPDRGHYPFRRTDVCRNGCAVSAWRHRFRDVRPVRIALSLRLSDRLRVSSGRLAVCALGPWPAFAHSCCAQRPLRGGHHPDRRLRSSLEL